MQRIILFLSLIISLTVYETNAQPIYAGIPRSNFNFFASAQRNSNWCWAASLQMIFNYYGVSITQEQIVLRSYGSDPYGQLPNWAGSLEIITRNLNNWNIDNSGNQYSVSASLNWGAPQPAFLVQELTQQRPILIGYKSGQGGHAVVITGCSYIPTSYGPQIQTVIVRDPWPSEANIANSGRVEHSGMSLASLMQAHWYIRVQR